MGFGCDIDSVLRLLNFIPVKHLLLPCEIQQHAVHWRVRNQITIALQFKHPGLFDRLFQFIYFRCADFAFEKFMAPFARVFRVTRSEFPDPAFLTQLDAARNRVVPVPGRETRPSNPATRVLLLRYGR